MSDVIGWILFIGLVVVVVRYSLLSGSPAAAVTAPIVRPAVVAATPPDDADQYDIVGESHYQQALVLLFGPKDEGGIEDYYGAALVLEPDNPHDRKAVRCEISGLKVGYLGRDDAKDFGKYMRRKKLSSLPVVALVRGGWKNARGEGSYGVTIEVPAGLVS